MLRRIRGLLWGRMVFSHPHYYTLNSTGRGIMLHSLTGTAFRGNVIEPFTEFRLDCFCRGCSVHLMEATAEGRVGICFCYYQGRRFASCCCWGPACSARHTEAVFETCRGVLERGMRSPGLAAAGGSVSGPPPASINQVGQIRPVYRFARVQFALAEEMNNHISSVGWCAGTFGQQSSSVICTK